MIRVLGRLRFTLALAAVLVTTQLVLHDRVLHHRMVGWFGTRWQLLLHGQVWRLATAVLVEDQPGIRWSIMVPFLWVGVAEWHLGWRRTGLVFFLTDWLSTVPVLIVLRIASAHSVWSATELARLDVGTSSAIYGTLAAFCASRRGSNAWLAPTIVMQSLITIWLTNRRLFDIQHLVAAGVGIGFGLWFAYNSQATPSLSRSSADRHPSSPT
ncbi:MAG: hypothetical protein ABI894_14160 [Ilumatobacteraceae bacterium]